jgi:pSer/pThr/pTyr-binding forkhead associated (FHA) protein
MKPPGEAERAHYLVVVEGAKMGDRIRLGPAAIVIGRKEPADWLLEDPRVSRSHCRVWLQLNDVIVSDLGSMNGTYVDGRPVFGQATLPTGSKLEIGSHILEHEWRIRKDVEES